MAHKAITEYLPEPNRFTYIARQTFVLRLAVEGEVNRSMRTPAGKDCRHYYQDFHRGKSIQECRLVKSNPESMPWKPSDCSRCPIPDILNANSSGNMELTLTIRPALLGFGRKMEIHATCLKHMHTIDNPYTGCPRCNQERPGLDVFWKALEGDDEPPKET